MQSAGFVLIEDAAGSILGKLFGIPGCHQYILENPDTRVDSSSVTGWFWISIAQKLTF